MIAPSDSEKLWQSLCEQICQPSADDDHAETETSGEERELLEAMAESYHNASHWSTHRQILSIMADKLTLKQLRQFIPDLTKYRFSTARQNRILHGRGTPPTRLTGRRMRSSFPSQVRSFSNFHHKSPHGARHAFWREVSRVVYWTADQDAKRHTPYDSERIAQQYGQYCEESGFSPMSKRTVLRVLDVCAASVRTSLQGVDNFSAHGSKAFQDLVDVVEKLANHGTTQNWRKERKQHLRSPKQYLKGYYKVRIIVCHLSHTN